MLLWVRGVQPQKKSHLLRLPPVLRRIQLLLRKVTKAECGRDAPVSRRGRDFLLDGLL